MVARMERQPGRSAAVAQFGRVGFLAPVMKDFKVLDVHTPSAHCLSSASRQIPASNVNGNVKIIPLSRTARDVRRFLNVSNAIYRNDPHWVAPLLMDLKKVFTNSNPLFEHAEMALWVAARNGQDVGRIAGIVDQPGRTTGDSFR